MEHMHKEEYAKLHEDEKKVHDKKPQGAAAATGNTAAKTQATIGAAFDKGRAFTRDDPRANAIMKLIMEMLALDDLPFNFVNNTGFQRLMKHVEPRYTMPYEKFFRTRMLPDMYTAVRTEVQDVIANAEHISFTTNAWTTAQCTDSLLID